ncbi:MAG: transglycosylase domain-containing protein [Chloroflexota bacterium]|nr:transglycosylase domain-containing protein [Chloroflexota bacterium]
MMISAYLSLPRAIFRRSIILLCVTAMLVNGCGTASEVPPAVNELTSTAQAFLEQYNAEFSLYPRPAGTAQAGAEAYMQRYQPGPIPRIFQSTYVYDRHGTLMAELFDEGRRTWLTLDRISPHLLNAVIATEDGSFYNNTGVDAVRMVGALIQNTETGGIVSGASTITMQLARNLFFEPARRFDQSTDRKIFEVLMAHDLTDLFSKDEILEMYLNIIYFGHLAYGPEAAAQTYFGKSAATLTLAEATLLAGIPQQPGEFDLFLNYADAKQRQRTVLDLMVRRGYLSDAQADEVWAQGVALTADPNLRARTILAPHFVTYLDGHVRQRFDTGDLRRAGLRIFTTLDLKMQAVAQEIVSKTVTALRPRYDLTNGALVALQPGTAQILTMVGSADYNDVKIKGAVNVAISPRQPGSSIKPILYATAFHDNLVSPTTVFWDLPISYPITEIQNYRPTNYDSKFRGPVTLRAALANSYNVPAVKLLDRVGIDRMRASASAMGIKSFDRNDISYGLGLTLGSNEATLLEMATAYHTIANNGQFLAAEPILSISDGRGNPLPDSQPAQPTPVISPDAAYLITNILSDNVARTPAFGANSVLTLTHPAAVKTGTTSSWRDNWTMGYSRYLLAGVWAGNSDGHPMRGISGITGAAPMWRDFMEAVFADAELLEMLDAPADPALWEFPKPAGVVQRQVQCPQNIGCRTDGEFYTQDWLHKMGEAHVLEDSIVTTKLATVLTGGGDGGRRVGVCADNLGAPNTVYRLPDGVGELAAFTPLTLLTASTNLRPDLPGALIPPRLGGPTRYFNPMLADFTLLPKRLQEEQVAVLNWSYRANAPLYLGPCDDVTGVIQGMFGNKVRSVTIQSQSTRKTVTIADNQQKVQADKAAEKLADIRTPTPRAASVRPPVTRAGDQTVVAVVPPTATPTPSPTPVATATPVAPAAPPQMPGSYVAAGITNDSNCPGNYILGQVLNIDGAPVAGVRVTFVDQWGNRGEAISKSGATDYGNYDFPIGTGEAREMYVTVVDGAGNPLSATIVVEHKQGAGGDAACHRVVWRAN